MRSETTTTPIPHVRPVHPETLRFICEQIGFERVQLEERSPHPSWLRESCPMAKGEAVRAPPERLRLPGLRHRREQMSGMTPKQSTSSIRGQVRAMPSPADVRAAAAPPAHGIPLGDIRASTSMPAAGRIRPVERLCRVERESSCWSIIPSDYRPSGRVIVALANDVVAVYHNVTPERYFTDETCADKSRMGRKQLNCSPSARSSEWPTPTSTGRNAGSRVPAGRGAPRPDRLLGVRPGSPARDGHRSAIGSMSGASWATSASTSWCGRSPFTQEVRRRMLGWCWSATRSARSTWRSRGRKRQRAWVSPTGWSCWGRCRIKNSARPIPAPASSCR